MMMAASSSLGLAVPRAGPPRRVQCRTMPLLAAVPKGRQPGARLRRSPPVCAGLTTAEPAPANDTVLRSGESRIPWRQTWWPVSFVRDMDASRPNACTLLGENLVLCVLHARTAFATGELTPSLFVQVV